MKLQAELESISEELARLGPLVDSGRCKGSDVQKLRRLLARYLEIEFLLKGLNGAARFFKTLTR